MALLVGYGCEYHATGLFATSHFTAGSFLHQLVFKAWQLLRWNQKCFAANQLHDAVKWPDKLTLLPHTYILLNEIQTMFSQLAKQSARVLPVDLCTDHVHYVENHRSTVLRRNKTMAVQGGTVSFIQFFNHFLCWVASWSIKIFTVGKILLLSADHHAGWSLCKLWEHCFSVPDPVSSTPCEHVFV